MENEVKYLLDLIESSDYDILEIEGFDSKVINEVLKCLGVN